MVCDHLPDVETEGGWTPVPAEGGGDAHHALESGRGGVVLGDFSEAHVGGAIAYSKSVSPGQILRFVFTGAGLQRGGQSLALAALRTESERTAVPLS